LSVLVFGMYIMFLFYIILRIVFAVLYYCYQQQHARWFYKNQQQNNIDTQNITAMEEAQKNCRILYMWDLRIKRIGSIVIGVFSLLVIWIEFQKEFQQENLFIVALPGLVSLFNSWFEFFEVQLDPGFQPAVPYLKDTKRNRDFLDNNNN